MLVLSGVSSTMS